MFACNYGEPGSVFVTETTMSYLELYTNNLEFIKKEIKMPNKNQNDLPSFPEYIQHTYKNIY